MGKTYSLQQQIYSLSFSANSAFGLSWAQKDCKSGMKAMQTYVTTVSEAVLSKTNGIIGDWKAVWGPVVYANDSSSNSVHADNTMGLYYSETQKTFVAAIAGTNGNSSFGWFEEDFAVGSTVSWEDVSGVAKSGNISKGTNTGLNILLNMTDSTGNTLIEALAKYIKANPTTVKKGTNIAVAGHSLGGALSPVLALYLYNKKSTWDPTGLVSIGAYPTAGPSPGDKKFAAYYEGLIGKKEITYLSQHNAIDIVPHAWQPSDLADIPTIYSANIIPPTTANPNEVITGTLASIAQLNALASSYTIFGTTVPKNPYTQITPSTTLVGTFDTTVDNAVTKKLKHVAVVLGSLAKYGPYVTNLIRFAAQAATQHTTAYYPLLKITTFMDAYKIILAANKPKDTPITEHYEAAVLDMTNLNLGAIDLSNVNKELMEKIKNKKK